MNAMSYGLILCCGLWLCTGRQANSQDAESLAWLKHDVGKWNVELSMWPQGEAGEPIVFQATETNEMFGDHWILSNFAGNFGGHELRGHGVYGFDAKKNCFVGSWVDSANGFMTHHEGPFDADAKTVELLGKEIDPVDGSLVDGKQVRSAQGNDHRTVISYQRGPDAEDFVKVIEMKYTRQK